MYIHQVPGLEYFGKSAPLKKKQPAHEFRFVWFPVQMSSCVCL